MSKVTTAPGLLLMALQDLLDGERQLVERLPEIEAAISDNDLARIISRIREESASQHQALTTMLTAMGEQPSSPGNIWMEGVLNDADNDIASIAEGRMRDIALVGALRKGMQSQRVSYETAMALAKSLSEQTTATDLRRICDEEQSTDDALAEMLHQLCDGIE